MASADCAETGIEPECWASRPHWSQAGVGGVIALAGVNRASQIRKLAIAVHSTVKRKRIVAFIILSSLRFACQSCRRVCGNGVARIGEFWGFSTLERVEYYRAESPSIV